MRRAMGHQIRGDSPSAHDDFSEAALLDLSYTAPHDFLCKMYHSAGKTVHIFHCTAVHTHHYFAWWNKGQCSPFRIYLHTLSVHLYFSDTYSVSPSTILTLSSFIIADIEGLHTQSADKALDIVTLSPSDDTAWTRLGMARESLGQYISSHFTHRTIPSTMRRTILSCLPVQCSLSCCCLMYLGHCHHCA